MIKGFYTTGAGRYFGKLTFEALMREVARQDSRIKVNAGKPLGVKYRP
jgi:hypothetical protein